MICYKYIDLENVDKISHDVYKFVIENAITKNRHSWNTLDIGWFLKKVPILTESFGKLNLTISNAAIIYRPPLYQGGVHIDSGTELRALLPVSNCAGSYTKFFEIDHNAIKISQGKENDMFYYVPDSAVRKEIASVETVVPFIFDPKIPHGVFTNPLCMQPRLTLTVGFVEKLSLSN
jgi:hypothetical protein